MEETVPSPSAKARQTGSRWQRLAIIEPLIGAVLRGLGRILFRIFFRLRVTGLEAARHCPPGTVVVANHVSFFDAAILACFLPFRVTFAISAAIADRFWVRLWFCAFSVVRVSPGRTAGLRQLFAASAAGERLVVFPEGRITVTGGLMEAWEGAARIAAHGSGFVLPCHLFGPEVSLWSLGRANFFLRRFPRFHLAVFPSVRVPSHAAGGEFLYGVLASASSAHRLQLWMAGRAPVREGVPGDHPALCAVRKRRELYRRRQFVPAATSVLRERAARFLAIHSLAHFDRCLLVGCGAGSDLGVFVSAVVDASGATILVVGASDPGARLGAEARELAPTVVFLAPGAAESFVRAFRLGDWFSLRRVFAGAGSGDVAPPVCGVQQFRLGFNGAEGFPVSVETPWSAPREWSLRNPGACEGVPDCPGGKSGLY